MNKILQAIIICTLIVWLTSCKKTPPSPDNGIPSTPIKTEIGTPNGNPVSKIIDASGGTIISDDKNLVINIPAGAVSSATTFTIQPVTNFIPNGIGTSYKLLPEGTHFNKLIDITFKYSDDSLKGSSTDYFHIGYQDPNGYWHVNKQTSINVNQKTIKASSDHFSVWSQFVELVLKQDKDILHPNESCNLQVQYVGTTDPKSDDVLISAFDKFPGVTWKLDDGEGTISTNNLYCTYKAPSSIPSKNPVTISANFKNVKTINLGTISTLSLLAHIEIKGEYFKITIDKTPYEFDNFQCGISNSGFGPKTTIIARGSASKITLDMEIMANTPGGYFFDVSDTRPTTGMNVTIGNSFLSSVYRDCNVGMSHSTVGHIQLTSVGNVGNFIDGNVDCALLDYSSDICHNFILKEVHGKFSIVRSQ